MISGGCSCQGRRLAPPRGGRATGAVLDTNARRKKTSSVRSVGNHGRRDIRGRLAVPTLAALLAASISNAAGKSGWHTIETINATPGHTVTIEANAASEDSPRLRFVDRRLNFIVTAPGGLVPLSNARPPGHPSAPSSDLGSKYLFAQPSLKDRNGFTLFIAFGHAYASDPGSIRVISTDAKGARYLALSDDTFDLHGTLDLDHDGIRELIGRRSLSQSSGKCAFSYDPYTVYRLSNRGQFEYSPDLSEAYNRAHYVWAGPRGREDITVNPCSANAQGQVRLNPSPTKG